MKYTLTLIVISLFCYIFAAEPNKKSEHRIEVCNLLDKNIKVSFMPKDSGPSAKTVVIKPSESVFVFTRQGFISINISSERFGQSVLCEPSITRVIVKRNGKELLANKKIPLGSQEICILQ